MLLAINLQPLVRSQEVVVLIPESVVELGLLLALPALFNEMMDVFFAHEVIFL